MDPLASRVASRFLVSGTVTEKIRQLPKDAAWKHTLDGVSSLERLIQGVQKDARDYAQAPAFRRASADLERALRELSESKTKLEAAQSAVKSAVTGLE